MKSNIIDLISKKTGLLILLTLVIYEPATSQQTYTIDATGAKRDILRGHLDLSGKSITGETIEVNNFYIERNGKPYFPVMGEFHYCRVPSQYCDEEIKKMKAGGIRIIATAIMNIDIEELVNFYCRQL